jgi:DNA repair protein RecN (Recombination protein N)
MLAGLDHTDTGRAHAEELLAAARAHREADRAADGAAPGRRRKKQAVAQGS